MNEIVKYNNYMNSLSFKDFTAIDMNFLMTLCNKLRDKGTSEIKISFEELREKTGYKQTSVEKFAADLERMNKKLMKITCSIKTESKTIMFVLFPTFEIDTENQLLIVSVNEKFKFILNTLINNFTRFELKEFVDLDSKYTKNLYRLLKQYRSTGHYEISIEKFREQMDIPKSYTNRDVMSKVISMSVKELKEYFQNLECKPQYARRRGKPVTGYIFTFTPESVPNEPNYSQTRNNYNSNQYSINNFINPPQRTYDYEKLEQELRFRR